MTNEPPKIPTNATRGKVYVWYNKLAYETVKKVIVHAINKVNAQNDIQTSTLITKLNAKHLDIIFEELGLPPKFKHYEKIDQDKL